MKNKNILVLGASRGIGKATAYQLSKAGANVILVARDEQKLTALSKELSNPSWVFPYDLTNLQDMENIFLFCKEQGIQLDGMVYSAGINRDMPVRVNDVEVMKEVLTLNYMAFVEAVKHYSKKKYSKEGSSIVVMSSNATNIIASGMNTYTASKAATEAAVQVMAKEMVKRKIRVNAVLPGCVDTEMVANAAFLDRDSISQWQPLGLIEPEYIALLVEFLLSEKSKYMTGALIPVSAGVL